MQLLVVAIFFILAAPAALCADPTLAAKSVHSLVGNGTWTQLAPPAIATAQCRPHHRLCKRFYDADVYELSSNVSSINFGMFEDGALRAQIYAGNILGVKRIHAHTGPRSSGHKNLQHPLWACPVVPEIELHFDPRGGDKTQLRPVLLEIIFYFEACDLDVVGGEDPREHLLLGVENLYTTQMKLSPVTAFSSRLNTDVQGQGQLALHVNLTTITPGHNRYMLVRGAPEAVAPAFNMEQGNSDQYLYDAQVTYHYPFMIGMLAITVVTLFLTAANTFRADRTAVMNVEQQQIITASNAQLVRALSALEKRMEALGYSHPTETNYM